MSDLTAKQVTATVALKPVRCRCGQMFFRAAVVGKLEVKCHKCGRLTVWRLRYDEAPERIMEQVRGSSG